LKFGRLVHYGHSRERLAGRATSIDNASLIVTFFSFYFVYTSQQRASSRKKEYMKKTHTLWYANTENVLNLKSLGEGDLHFMNAFSTILQ